MENMLRNKKMILLFILPALALYSVFLLFPVVSSIYNSFFDWNIVGERKFAGFKNYQNLLLIDNIFKLSFKNTVSLILLSVITQLPAAILLAFAIFNLKTAKQLFKSLFFIPNILSSASIGLMWSYIYNPDFGLLNSMLKILGLDGFTRFWLADEKSVLICIIVVVCWQSIGYYMVLFLAGVENMPESIIESAKLEGCGWFDTLIHIIIPYMRPVIRVAVVLVITGSFRYFDLFYVMTNGGPNHASEVMALYMYIRTFRGMQYGYGSAISVILLLLALIVTVIVNKAVKNEDY